MKLNEMITAMKTPRTAFFIHYSQYAKGWDCHMEYSGDKEKFKFESGDCDTIEDAVRNVYQKFIALTHRGKSFVDAIPAQLETTASDVTQEFNDEIPY